MTACFLIIALANGSIAQEGKDAKESKDAALRLKEQAVKTKHSIQLGGQKLEYEATAGTILLKEEEGKPMASFFYVAYTKLNSDLAKRPITFSFNGGPGSSSVWLHMGAYGPKRVLLSDEGEALKPPARIVDNEGSILDVTDLVFIDPVSTGFSRAAEEKDAKKFHGVEEDLQAVGEFIRLYSTRNGRWQSPKYLSGESYGTTRAAALVQQMQSRHAMSFNGVILVSAVLNFETIAFNDGNDLPYPLFLPGYTATAWHHKKLSQSFPSDLKTMLAEVEKFAVEEYTVALMKGSTLSDAERQNVARKLAFFTGLSEDYILRADLRIDGQRFMRELLRKDGATVGRFDSRYAGKSGNNNAERPDTDFSYHAVHGPYSTALQTYLRQDLNFQSDLPYEILTGRVQPWNYGAAANNRYLNVAPRLRDAMTANKYLRVFVANGYYDLATPYFATEYTFNHLGGDKSLSERVTMGFYEAGHMMYTHRPSLRKLREDLTKFYGSGTN
ncbi:MAG: peptidase S10 [Planctomycetes bacterium]|nr:peptidase S10 [Planctomycetota bacterium]